MKSEAQEFRDNIARLLLRDLAAMRREVEQYPNDESLWKAVPGLTNAGGNLVLHICGNLQHFIGTVLGGTGYARNRDAEFIRRGLTRVQLTHELDNTIGAVSNTLSTLSASKLEGLFPQDLGGSHVPTDTWLGQVDYHRRCVTGDATTVGTMSIPALLIPFPPMTT
jgi:hypothetical protein